MQANATVMLFSSAIFLESLMSYLTYTKQLAAGLRQNKSVNLRSRLSRSFINYPDFSESLLNISEYQKQLDFLKNFMKLQTARNDSVRPKT